MKNTFEITSTYTFEKKLNMKIILNLYSNSLVTMGKILTIVTFPMENNLLFSNRVHAIRMDF